MDLPCFLRAFKYCVYRERCTVRGILPRFLIWRAIFSATFKNTCCAQVFRVELDRIARKHFRVAIDRMRTAARRRFAKLFALRFAIVGIGTNVRLRAE